MNRRDIALAVLVMALWGMHYVIIRVGATEIPPFLLLSLRFFLCSLVFLPFARRITREEFKNITLYAIPFQGLHMGLLFLGLSQVDSSITALVMKAGVPFSILLAWIFHKERFGLKTFIGLCTALLGGVIFLHNPAPDSNFTWLGIIALVLSSFFWAVGSLRLKNIKDLNFPTMIFYAFTIPLPFAIAATMLLEHGQAEALKNADHLLLAGVLTYQVIVISFSHYLWKVLLGRNPVYAVTPFSLLTPVFGLSFGVMILHESMSPTMFTGAAIAMLGLGVITIRGYQRKRDIA